MTNCRRTLCKAALPAASMVALTLFYGPVPRAWAAQAIPDPPVKSPAPDNTTDPARASLTGKSAPPEVAPANPLVLVNPQDGTGNAVDRFDPNGNRKRPRKSTDTGDYRGDGSDPRTVRTDKQLPLYGYSFFLPSRRLILARSARMLRDYESDSTQSYGGYGQSSTRRPATGLTPRRRTGAPNRQNPDRIATPFDPELDPRPADATPDSTGTPRADDGSLYTTRKRKRAAGASGTTDSGAANTDDTGAPAADDGQSVPTRAQRARAAADADAAGSQDAQDGTVTDPQSPTAARDAAAIAGVGGVSALAAEDAYLNGASSDPGTQTRSEQLVRERQRRSLAGLDQFEQNNLAFPTTDPQAMQNRGPLLPGQSGVDRSQDYLPATGSPYSRAYDPYYERYPATDPNEAIDASKTVVDPLSQLYHNVIATAPTSYQLSAGDVITVRYWSPTLAQTTVSRTVDATGALSVPEVGAIVVRGMNLSQAQALVQRRMQSYYKRVEVSLSLRDLRTISVTVSGEAFLPGSYTVPAVASAFNVLYAAGGPTHDGTLRDIEVHRQGKLIGSIDVYKLMTAGTQNDISLQSGDQIYIPAAYGRVAVRGEVRRPALFELKQGETLQDALHFAGGVKASGVDQLVQLNTVAPGASRVLKNVDLSDAHTVASTKLYDGDGVEIFSVRPVVTNKVTIEGAVDQPSEYALEPGMRVVDLVRRARGTLPEAYLSRIELYRWNANNTTTLIPINLDQALAGDAAANVPLARWDRIKIFRREEVAWSGFRKVNISGAVQRPGVYDLSENTHVRDLLMQAGGPRPDAFLDRAVLLHQHGDGSYSYDYVKLADAIHGDAGADVLVQDNDLLAVYKVNEAQFTPDHLVSVRGEVVAPGIYPRGDNMKLSDLVNLAGGFKPNAGVTVVVAHARRQVDGPDAVTHTVSVKFTSSRECAPQDNLPLQDGDVVTVQGTGGFMDRVQIVTIKGAVNKPGPIILTSKHLRMTDALKQAGGLRPEAFPEGAEFFREPSMLATTGQRSLAETISRLSNIFNNSQFKRDLAKSDIDRIKAAGSASQDSSSFTTSPYPAAPNPAAAVLATQLSQHDLVSAPRTLNAGDLEPNGNIAVNLPEALRKPSGNDDILLVDGDTITVPEKPTTVQVVGAVVNSRGVLWKPGAPIEYYVALAGGFAPDAAKDRMVVIHAGGGLIPSNKVRDLQPGDVLLVPTRVLSTKLEANHNSLDSVFKSLTSSLLVYKIATGLFGL